MSWLFLILDLLVVVVGVGVVAAAFSIQSKLNVIGTNKKKKKKKEATEKKIVVQQKGNEDCWWNTIAKQLAINEHVTLAHEGDSCEIDSCNQSDFADSPFSIFVSFSINFM